MADAELSELTLVWLHTSDDKNKYELPDVWAAFGNRADALVYAYHECFRAIIQNEKREIFPLKSIAYENTMFEKTNIPEDETLWPKKPMECALYLRQIVRKNRRYLIDDHMEDYDKWHEIRRKDDLETEYGNIKISIRDTNVPYCICWSSLYKIKIKQYPVINNTDDSKDADPNVIQTLFDSISKIKINNVPKDTALYFTYFIYTLKDDYMRTLRKFEHLTTSPTRRPGQYIKI